MNRMNRESVMGMVVMANVLCGIFAFGVIGATRAVENEIVITTGTYHTCVLVDDRVKCWGDDSEHQLDVPSGLRNVRIIAAGDDHTCVVDNGGMKCWGYNRYSQLDVPSGQEDVRAIAAGCHHTCAVHDDAVTCWGDNMGGQLDVPSGLENVRAIAAGSWHTCMLDDNGMKCWGSNHFGQSSVPSGLRNVRAITAGENHTCAVHDDDVTCWGANDYGQSSVPSGLRNVRTIAAGDYHTCVLDDDGVKCWGRNNFDQSTVPPGISNPQSIAAGHFHTCAVNDDGVKCWGDNDYGQLNVPEDIQERVRLTIPFSLPRLEGSFERLSRVVYPYKSEFFTKLSNAVSQYPIDSSAPVAIGYRSYLARFFTLFLVGPVIETTESQHVQEKVLPRYKGSLEEGGKLIGIFKLSKIELIPSVFNMSVESIRLSLEACRGFLVDEADRRELEGMVSELGVVQAQFKASGYELSMIVRLKGILDAHGGLIGKLSDGPRTRGFGTLLLQVKEYLGARA